LIGPDSQKDAAERASEDRQTDKQAEFGLIKPEVGFDPDADDGEDRSDCETYGESNRRKPKRPA
jgi:hypothetical protein